MRYWATMSRDKRPEINGCLAPIGVNPAGTSCHVFKAAGDEVKVYHVTGGKELRVPMIAYELMENKSLYGPASLMDKTLIYPCEEFQCRVSCPCAMCRNKLGYCDDLEDHEIYHRANHTMCRFCKELESLIPHFHHKVVYERVNNWHVRMTHIINFVDKLGSSSLFQHDYASARNPVKMNSLLNCDKCEKKFKSVSHFKRHEMSVHFGMKEKCPYCSLQTSRRDNLEAHILLVHGSERESAYQCDDCQETFDKKSNFERHSRNSKTNCSICSEMFCTLKQLQQHTLTSHPARHACSTCKKTFQDNANLKRHSKSTASELKCEKCHQGFCTFIAYKKHKKCHEQIECSHCKNRFSSKFNLKTHIANRSDQRCDQCGEMFCNSQSLKLHHSKVHNVKTCHICSTTYCLKNYRHHMYSEHQQVVEFE